MGVHSTHLIKNISEIAVLKAWVHRNNAYFRRIHLGVEVVGIADEGQLAGAKGPPPSVVGISLVERKRLGEFAQLMQSGGNENEAREKVRLGGGVHQWQKVLGDEEAGDEIGAHVSLETVYGVIGSDSQVDSIHNQDV